MTKTPKTILLLAVNARYTHSNPALYYLRNYCVGTGANFVIREYSIKASPENIIDEIQNTRPHVVALSVYIWNSKYMEKLLPMLTSLSPKPVIVCGGPEVSYNPESWIDRHPGIDYIVCGPGEAGFCHLVENEFNVDEKIIRKANPHFNEIPYPYRPEDRDRLSRRYVYYETSRGCPFRCGYCISSREDQQLQFKDFSTVKNEMDQLLAMNPGVVKLVDRTFNAGSKHARAIWHYLIEKNPQARFHFEIYPGLLKEEDLRLLEKVPAGLFQFEIGVQSLNNRSLEAVSRPPVKESHLDGVRHLLEHTGIHVHLDLMAGLPHDTLKSLANSFNVLYGIKPHHLQLGFLKLLPGTAMREQAETLSLFYSAEPPYEIQETPWISSEEMNMLHHIEGLVNSLFNSGYFPITLPELEDLHSNENYFHMYKSLALFWKSKELNTDEKDGGMLSSGLLAYIQEHFPAKYIFFRDCLRMDWIGRTGNMRYPKSIQGERHPAEIRGALGDTVGKDPVFAADSEEFSVKYMSGIEYKILKKG
ncbi:MAG TPA: radical SAM protein [Spirochaetota bacterium]|nr:radical SAM protein [Spirochaetota bacterium]